MSTGGDVGCWCWLCEGGCYDSLSCLLSWFNKDQYETAGGTMIVHESRTAGEPGTRSIE